VLDPEEQGGLLHLAQSLALQTHAEEEAGIQRLRAWPFLAEA
jgi:hypothetical protein